MSILRSPGDIANSASQERARECGTIVENGCSHLLTGSQITAAKKKKEVEGG